METTLPRDLVTETLSPDDARAIAKAVYIYGFPMVDSYRIQCDDFQDKNNPEFKAPRKHIANIQMPYTLCPRQDIWYFSRFHTEQSANDTHTLNAELIPSLQL